MVGVAAHRDRRHERTGEWIAGLPIGLARPRWDLTGVAPRRSLIGHQRVVHPLGDLMTGNRSIRGRKEGFSGDGFCERASRIPIGDRVSLHRRAHCAVVAEDTASGGGRVILHHELGRRDHTGACQRGKDRILHVVSQLSIRDKAHLPAAEWPGNDGVLGRRGVSDGIRVGEVDGVLVSRVLRTPGQRSPEFRAAEAVDILGAPDVDSIKGKIRHVLG